ncbi:MAG: putative HTH-type transcriptional regulator [Myxococcota bacterium]|nr:putative HTH-type transcriptional regulator [Myxococcota bacterium]
MIYSNTCRDTIAALSILASDESNAYVLLDDLCKSGEMSRHVMAKIFQELVRKGILVSARGRGGGFALSRPGEDINLLEIVEAVDGLKWMELCVVGLARCDEAQPCPLHEQWTYLRSRIRQYLVQTTLADRCHILHNPQMRNTGQPTEVCVSLGVRRRRP